MSEDSFYVWYGSCVIWYNTVSHLWFYINKEISEEELDPWERVIEEPAQSSKCIRKGYCGECQSLEN